MFGQSFQFSKILNIILKDRYKMFSWWSNRLRWVWMVFYLVYTIAANAPRPKVVAVTKSPFQRSFCVGDEDMLNSKCSSLPCRSKQKQRELEQKSNSWIKWTTDWLNYRLIDWLIDWASEWVTGWLVEWLIDWLTDWLIADWLMDWWIDINWMRFIIWYMTLVTMKTLSLL